MREPARRLISAQLSLKHTTFCPQEGRCNPWTRRESGSGRWSRARSRLSLVRAIELRKAEWLKGTGLFVLFGPQANRTGFSSRNLGRSQGDVSAIFDAEPGALFILMSPLTAQAPRPMALTRSFRTGTRAASRRPSPPRSLFRRKKNFTRNKLPRYVRQQKPGVVTGGYADEKWLRLPSLRGLIAHAGENSLAQRSPSKTDRSLGLRRAGYPA